MSDLVRLSATDGLRLMRAGQLSPVEWLDALLAHVDVCEPHVNAVVDRRDDEARAEAAAAADRYARGVALPLDGVPVAAKEEQPMRGRSWQQGSLTLRDTIATEDHPIIERIQHAGGVIHVRTATPEFSCAGFCHSRLWGVTRNPWNLHFSPGGSSGGTGAALAAGYAPIGTGSDIGGSIRIPASFSGVVGFKPPFGRVPAMPPYNLDQYCHDGPMGRTVADTALLENVIAGPHPMDQAALRFPPHLPDVPEQAAGVTVALCMRLGDWPLAPEVEHNTRRAAEALAAAGAHVEEVQLPWTMEAIWRAAQAHFAAIMGAGIAGEARTRGEQLCDYTVAFATTMHSDLDYYHGMELEGALWRPLGELFERYDAVLCPTMAVDGFVAGEAYLGGIDIRDEHADQHGHLHVDQHIKGAMTLPFNMFSRCPVLSVPSGLAANGVPTGVQVVGRTYDDVTAFRVASALEAALVDHGVGFGSPSWWPPVQR